MARLGRGNPASAEVALDPRGGATGRAVAHRPSGPSTPLDSAGHVSRTPSLAVRGESAVSRISGPYGLRHNFPAPLPPPFVRVRLKKAKLVPYENGIG